MALDWNKIIVDFGDAILMTRELEEQNLLGDYYDAEPWEMREHEADV